MTELTILARPLSIPALIAAAGDKAGLRFVECFPPRSATRRSRRAYVRAVSGFLDWCYEHGMVSVIDVEPLHVAAWLEQQTKAGQSAPSVKQRGSAIPFRTVGSYSSSPSRSRASSCPGFMRRTAPSTSWS